MADNAPPTAPANEQQVFARLMHEHMQWLFKMHGAPGLSTIVGLSLAMGSTLNNSDGSALSPDMQRFSDACVAAHKAYQAAAGAGIIAAPAYTRVNGKRIV